MMASGPIVFAHRTRGTHLTLLRLRFVRSLVRTLLLQIIYIGRALYRHISNIRIQISNLVRSNV